jgi:hypothetical protein
MRRWFAVGVIGFLVSCLALNAAGQAGNVAQIFVQVPKPGANFEAGRKKHTAFHKAQKDSWNLVVWEVVTGEGTGHFISGTFGHEWKDFDTREKFDAADAADVAVNLAPNLASNQTSYWTYRQELSLSPESFPPAPMITVAHYFVHPEHINQFQDAIKKINEAIKKSNYPAPPSRWYSLANGGLGPHFVLVQDRKTFADLKGPDKPLQDMLEEVYGKTDGGALLDAIRKSIDHTNSELLRYREDLSYLPAK